MDYRILMSYNFSMDVIPKYILFEHNHTMALLKKDKVKLMAKLHDIGYEKTFPNHALPGSGADTLMVRQQLATYEVV